MNTSFCDTEIFELTESQKSVLTGQLMQPSQPLYNMCMSFHINGEINPQAFKSAFQKLIASCDVLRTVIVENDNGDATQAKQTVLQEFEYELVVHDFSLQCDPQTKLAQWIEQHRVNQFDLQSCLFESALIKLSNQSFVWFLSQHHLMTDAWSMSVLFKQMEAFYLEIVQERSLNSSVLFDFREYVKIEQQKKQTKRFSNARDHWDSCSQTPFSTTNFYRANERDKSARTTRVNCNFGMVRSRQIKQLAQEQFLSFSEDLSVMQIFSTLLFSFLYRISGNNALAIGTPVHSRTSEQLRQTAGLLINIYPLQISVSENETFHSLFEKVAKANQQTLINAIPGSGDMKLARKFDVVLNYIPSAFGSFCDMPVNTQWVHSGYGDRDHVLRMQVHDFDQSGEFSVYFDLNEDVFSPKERAWVCEHFLILVDSFLASTDTPIRQPPLVDFSPQLYQNLDCEAEFDELPSVISLFSQQVLSTPDSIALIDGQQSMSYQQLEKCSLQFANYLVGQGVGTGDVVALNVGRSMHAVVAIMGISTVGAAFLPIDVAHPAKRINFILKDSNAKLLIVDHDTQLQANKILNVNTDWDRVLETGCTIKMPVICPDDLAYVIYTSGSTGQPKGVMIQHQGLANYIQWSKKYYLAGEVLDFPLFSSLSFDLTITSLFTPLISGGSLVIYNDVQQDSGFSIHSVIEDNRVDVIKLTPAHLALIQSFDFSTSRLKKLIVGGDDFKTELAQNMSRFFAGEIEIFNEYGPTEATVACTVHKFDIEHDKQGSVPIGRPIDNANIYLFDDDFNLVPQGCAGEIYISGVGLAKGYMQQPEMTSQRFITNPHNPQEMLYKTGDRGMFNHRGLLEYLGRNDGQVKLNGSRIETSEVESALLQYTGVSEAVVDLSTHLAQQQNDEQRLYCAECGLEANHPSAQIDAKGMCRICRIYQKQKAQASSYFRTYDDLVERVAEIKRDANAKQDSIMLLSGGKDSSYALCKLVEMGLTPLVFTLDNGYISDGAKANIQRLVDRLGLELYVGETTAMNDIFVDSLTRFSNVCNGCFKTIYTLSMKVARERGIKVICTGLSRGQIFESRVAHLFQQGCFDAKEIDTRIIDARKTYHRTNDIIANRLDVKVFEDDSIFEEIEYLDVYRYLDVTLDEMYQYLNNIAPWIRPSDTGRSTNCLINDAGIYIHKRERGYHNYSLPYSWDVRLGHKKRDSALEELDDEIDQEKVEKILSEIGYKGEDVYSNVVRKDNLIGYYVAPSEILKNSLQKHLASTLPKEYIPNQFVWMSALPLTANGKVDRQALPRPRESRRELEVDYVAPRKTTEILLVSLWQKILGVEEVGIDDNFFDLGGDSIVNIQIVSAAREKSIVLTPQQIFDYPTIRELATVAKEDPKLTHSVDGLNAGKSSPDIAQQDLDDIFSEFGEE